MVDEQVALYSSFLMMSLAIAVDAFSVSLSIGLQKIRLKRVFMFSFTVGLLHTLLPFIGIVLGKIISTQIEQMAHAIGGAILIGLGSYMFFSAFVKKGKTYMIQSVGKLMTIAFIVSVDSFSIGLSLGISGISTLLIIFMFGITSAILSIIGIIIGKKARRHLSQYSEVLGGIVLFIFGLMTMFK